MADSAWLSYLATSGSVEREAETAHTHTHSGPASDEKKGGFLIIFTSGFASRSSPLKSDGPIAIWSDGWKIEKKRMDDEFSVGELWADRWALGRSIVEDQKCNKREKKKKRVGGRGQVGCRPGRARSPPLLAQQRRGGSQSDKRQVEWIHKDLGDSVMSARFHLPLFLYIRWMGEVPIVSTLPEPLSLYCSSYASRAKASPTAEESSSFFFN